jgi:hypothetical protein
VRRVRVEDEGGLQLDRIDGATFRAEPARSRERLPIETGDRGLDRRAVQLDGDGLRCPS